MELRGPAMRWSAENVTTRTEGRLDWTAAGDGVWSAQHHAINDYDDDGGGGGGGVDDGDGGGGESFQCSVDRTSLALARRCSAAAAAAPIYDRYGVRPSVSLSIN